MSAGLEILHLHAQGGMAEVYKARADDASGRSWFYAVKRMLPELLRDPEMMRMFIEEQRIAACLEHDNIVRVYDVARAEGSETFIVMEFLEGRDLAEVIGAADEQKRAIPVWFAIHVARELLKALHYASREARDKSGRLLGLIHRDVTPHNVFITRNGNVKLTDFGVARVDTATVKTQAGVIKGKFGYMSPEQLAAKPLDHRSDLYNVGIVLFETITNTNLFSGTTPTQFVASMMRNEVPPFSPSLHVPPELDGLVRRALDRAPSERPTTALAFESELAAIARRYSLGAGAEHVAYEMAAIFPELRAPPPPPKAKTQWRALTTSKPLLENDTAPSKPAFAPSSASTSPTPMVDKLPDTAPMKQAPGALALGAADTIPPPGKSGINDSTVEVTAVSRPASAESDGFTIAKTEAENAPRPPTPPGKHRVSTGSRRVIDLDAEKDKTKP
jgi:serine/threonine protein kinase